MGIRNPCSTLVGTMRESTASLSGAPRELWLCYLLKGLASFAYFSMSINLTIYLSEEFAFSDPEAGWLYGMWGVLISAYGLLSGPLIDKLGVRLSLVLGSIVAACGRFLLTIAWSRWVAITCLATLVPFGEALAVPVLTIAIKRYTSHETRSYAYGLFYTCMNVASLLSGPITDLFRTLFSKGFMVGGAEITAIRLVFFTGTITTLLYMVIAWRYFREINVDAAGNVEEYRPQEGSTCDMLRTSVRDSRFWRLALFTLLIMFVKLLFRHLDATFPKYVRRELGPDTPYGSIYAINPAMVILLVPVISAYSRGVHPFKLIVRGSFVTAASPFVLLFGASYFTSIMFVVMLSAGEVIYSPPVYEYSMMLAPKGREGLYTSMASAPMFVAKLFVGGLSGILLQQYCPKEPPRDCDTMWLIIGLMSAASPVLMCVLQRVIQPEGTSQPMRSDEDEGIAMTGIETDRSDEGGSGDESPEEKGADVRKFGSRPLALLAEGDRELDVGGAGFGTIAAEDTPPAEDTQVRV